MPFTFNPTEIVDACTLEELRELRRAIRERRKRMSTPPAPPAPRIVRMTISRWKDVVNVGELPEHVVMFDVPVDPEGALTCVTFGGYRVVVQPWWDFATLQDGSTSIVIRKPAADADAQAQPVIGGTESAPGEGGVGKALNPGGSK